MKTRISFCVCALILLLLVTPVSALACACCSEPGTYFSGSVEFSEHYRGEFERMRFGRTAALYLSPAGIDEDSEGITQPSESYSLTGAFASNVLKLSFRSGANQGVLQLVLAESMWKHAVDIHDRKLSPGGGPLLYKEWRFEGEATGTGIFKPGFTAPARYTLVLQGRGNGCDNAGDFTHWRVAINGKDASYAFHGSLARTR